jgi:hypothetical protein
MDKAMDMTRMIGVGALLLGFVLVVMAWQNTAVDLTPLTATIGGYARTTVLLGATGILALLAGSVAVYMGKTTA